MLTDIQDWFINHIIIITQDATNELWEESGMSFETKCTYKVWLLIFS